jgi:hypothetical protein
VIRARLARGVVYVFYLIAVVLAVGRAFHWRWEREVARTTDLRDTAPRPEIDSHTARRLGRLDRIRRNSFARIPPEKPSGTVRIGCFGDSFTFGLEVWEGSEYASLLERLFREHGRPEVQVINFGNSGFGLHQTYMMWDYVGRKYGLDAAIFLPLPRYWRGRDTTFTLFDPPRPNLSFHARYVLDGDDLALVDVVGDTEAEKFAHYFGFLTPLRYLRYDSKPPAFVRAWLPRGRTLDNPFYYQGLGVAEDEVDETYRRLARRLAAAGIPIVLADVFGEVGPWADDEQSATLSVEPVRMGEGFPYDAASGHWSPIGHRLLAEQLLRLFDEHAQAEPVPFVRIGNLEGTRTATVDEPLPVKTLDQYDRVSARIGDTPAGRFYRYVEGSVLANPMTRFPPDVKALFAISLSSEAVVDDVFIAVPHRRAGTEVYAERNGVRRPLRVVPGAVGGEAILTRVELCQASTWIDMGVHWPGRCEVPHPWAPKPPGEEVTIALGGVRLLSVVVTPSVVWVLPPSPYYRLRGEAGGHGALDVLGDDGFVTIELSRSGEQPIRLPIAGWTRENVQFRPRRTIALPALH